MYVRLPPFYMQRVAIQRSLRLSFKFIQFAPLQKLGNIPSSSLVFVNRRCKILLDLNKSDMRRSPVRSLCNNNRKIIRESRPMLAGRHLRTNAVVDNLEALLLLYYFAENVWRLKPNKDEWLVPGK